MNMSADSSDKEDCLGDTESEEDVSEERVRLGERFILFPSKTLTEHGNVLEGEIISDVAHARNCAIKFPRLADETSREVEALLKLGCHSHLVALLASEIYRDSISEHSYIALEKCHKWNLRQHLLHRKQTLPVFDVNWALKFCGQIIDGMTFVHDKLIIHKDLKPSNILLTHDLENIKIADFGSSQVVKTTSSMVYCPNMFGTLGFRPPESFGGSYVSLKSDIFSLGVLLYFLLSDGESPFGEQSELWDHNTKKGETDISKLKVSNPGAAGHLIRSMLSGDRQCRPSIVQAQGHPCWSGEEHICDFDYGIAQEFDDCNATEPDTDDVVTDFDLDRGERLFAEAILIWKSMRNSTKKDRALKIPAQEDSTLSYPEEIENAEIQPYQTICEGFTIFHEGLWRKKRYCIEEPVSTQYLSSLVFARKLRSLSELQHRNIIRLHAVTTDNPRRLVLELAESRHLYGYLIANKEILTRRERLNFSCQIASGMDYIASKNYIHGCLCTSGILVGKDGNLKISRFRLAHRIGEVQEECDSLIQRYSSAPEVNLSGKFTQKSDVWSYGVVLYGIYSDARTPDIVDWAGSRGRMIEKPQKCPENIYEKMRECFTPTPQLRPDFSELKVFFDGLI